MHFFFTAVVAASVIHCLPISFASGAVHNVALTVRGGFSGVPKDIEHNHPNTQIDQQTSETSPLSDSQPGAPGADDTKLSTLQVIKNSESYGSKPLAPPHNEYEVLSPATYRTRGKSAITQLHDDVRSDDVSYDDVKNYPFYKEVGPVLFKPLQAVTGLSEVFKELGLDTGADGYTYLVENEKTVKLRAIGDFLYYPKEGVAVVKGIHSQEDPYRSGKEGEDPKGHTIGLPSSNMLYQGLVKVASKVASTITSVVRDFRFVLQQHIANKGTQSMINKVYTDLGLDVRKPQRFRLNDPDIKDADRAKWNDAFYDLAGTDNVRPVIWMARDHRKALGGVIDIYIHVWTSAQLGSAWMAIELVKAGDIRSRTVDLGFGRDETIFGFIRRILGKVSGSQSQHSDLVSNCGRNLALGKSF